MALGDPHLVRRMEGGRSLTLRTADRVLAFVAGYGGRSGGARDPPRRPRHRKPSREPRRTKSTTTTDQPRSERTGTPTRILRLPDVQDRTGLSRTMIYRWRVAGRFPQAVPLGTRCVGWIESELEGWMCERMADRPGGGEPVAH